jgi:hypothetical protein
MKEDDKVFYTFYYNNPTETGGDFPTAKQTEVTLEFESEVRWPSVIDEFVAFLSSVYGYPIDLHKHYGGSDD